MLKQMDIVPGRSWIEYEEKHEKTAVMYANGELRSLSTSGKICLFDAFGVEVGTRLEHRMQDTSGPWMDAEGEAHPEEIRRGNFMSLAVRPLPGANGPVGVSEIRVKIIVSNQAEFTFVRKLANEINVEPGEKDTHFNVML